MRQTAEVCRFANVLKRNKIRKATASAYLSADNSGSGYRGCWPGARIGVHSVVFGGFSAEVHFAIAIADSGAIAVTGSGRQLLARRHRPLKRTWTQEPRHQFSIKRDCVSPDRKMTPDDEGRDVWWHRELEYVNADCPPSALDSEHPLYILGTERSTRKPKGVLAHKPARVIGRIYSTAKYVPRSSRDDDVFWCTLMSVG